MNIDIPLEVQEATLKILKDFGYNAGLTYGCLLIKKTLGIDERQCKRLIKNFLNDVQKTLPGTD